MGFVLMRRILEFVTMIAIAIALGVRFPVGLMELISDWRVWVAAAASGFIWSILGGLFAGQAAGDHAYKESRSEARDLAGKILADYDAGEKSTPTDQGEDTSQRREAHDSAVPEPDTLEQKQFASDLMETLFGGRPGSDRNLLIGTSLESDPKPVESARAAYADFDPGRESPFALCRKGGDEGFLLTNNAFYCRLRKSMHLHRFTSGRISLSAIRAIEFRHGTLFTDVFLDGSKIGFVFKMIPDEASRLEAAIDAISTFLKNRRCLQWTSSSYNVTVTRWGFSTSGQVEVTESGLRIYELTSDGQRTRWFSIPRSAIERLSESRPHIVFKGDKGERRKVRFVRRDERDRALKLLSSPLVVN